MALQAVPNEGNGGKGEVPESSERDSVGIVHHDLLEVLYAYQFMAEAVDHMSEANWNDDIGYGASQALRKINQQLRGIVDRVESLTSQEAPHA